MDLNVSRGSTCLMSSGRAFHKVAALWENALYPYVLRLHLGTIKSFFLDDLRFLLGIRKGYVALATHGRLALILRMNGSDRM